MLQGKAVVGATVLILLCGCAPTGKEARVLADAAVASRPTASAPSAPAAGLKVFIDPATGQQRAPTAEEWASMMQRQEQRRQESGAPPPAPMREIRLPDGTQGYVLGDASQMYLRACKEADGAAKVGHDCPHTKQDATNEKVP